MQFSPAISSVNQRQAENRPHSTSFDCGQEFSLEHWLEVNWLVEREEDDLAGYVFDDPLLLVSH